MEKSQGGTQVTFDGAKRLFALETPHSDVELLETTEHGRVLLMDGEVQFAENDEHRYHEMLVHPVMNIMGPKRSVLILGGGDGLAAREVLKWKPEHIDIVDYDEMFVRKVGMDLIRDMNEDSFYRENVTYICRDARGFLKNGNRFYDAILVDLPDPDGDEMEKLYHDVLVECAAGLKMGGVLSLHIGGLLLTKEHACWKFIRQTRHLLERIFPDSQAVLRTAHIPSFMNIWGFLYLHHKMLMNPSFYPKDTRYWDLNDPRHNLMFSMKDGLEKDIFKMLF